MAAAYTQLSKRNAIGRATLDVMLLQNAHNILQAECDGVSTFQKHASGYLPNLEH